MPIYVYHCEHCGHDAEAYQSIRDEPLPDCEKCLNPWHRVPQAAASPQREFATPIEMHSIACCTPEEVRVFKQRHPEVQISDKVDDPLFGVPIAKSRHQKLAILDKEGFAERN